MTEKTKKRLWLLVLPFVFPSACIIAFACWLIWKVEIEPTRKWVR